VTSASGGVEPPSRLGEPQDELSPLARAAIRIKMVRHGSDASALIEAVTLLQYRRAHGLAEDVAQEPALARPLTSEAEQIANALPERFFRYQEELSKQARRLSEAAAAERPDLLGAQFGRTVQVCIGCHAEYLRNVHK
jgi:hypothetical protein